MDCIPRSHFFDRMEVTRDPQVYTDNEKAHIANEHLIPKSVWKLYGIPKGGTGRSSRSALRKIILTLLPREAGVRGLERKNRSVLDA